MVASLGMNDRHGQTAGSAITGRGALLLGTAAGLALIPLLTGLGHGFYRDDFTWLEHACRPGATILDSLRPWKNQELRSLGQLLFYIQYRLFGFHPLGFNIVSLLLHLTTVGMVVCLARLAGQARGLALAAGVLFLAGLGHYGKPEAWACAQVIILGPLLAAAGLAVFLAQLRRPADARRFPYWSYPLLAAAVFTHEITFLAPLGLALVAFQVRHPHRRLMAGIGLLAPAAYFLATLPMHQRHPVAATSISVLLHNIFYFPAAYLFPLQGMDAWMRILGRASSAPVWPGAAEALPILLGAGVLLALALYTWKASPLMRGLIAFGFLLLAPAFAMPTPSRWIEVRYLYPATIFWSPAICAGLYGLGSALRPKARSLLVVLLVLWYLGILTGSLYIQRRAREDAADPTLSVRWQRLEELMGKPIPH